MSSTPAEKPFSLATFFADQVRAAGGELFTEGKYELAVAKYTEAIGAFGKAGVSEGLGVCLTNRAIACAKLGWWAESYCDARSATRCCPKYGKAWFRAGVALEHLGMARVAGAAFYRAIEVDESLQEIATPALKRCRLASIASRTNRQPLLTAASSVNKSATHTLSSEGQPESTCSERSHSDDTPSQNKHAVDTPVLSDGDESGRLVIGLGPGRCGLHSLGLLLQSQQGAFARCLSTGSDCRPLLWSPTEARSGVIRRRLDDLRQMLRRDASVRVVADIHYAWLPYARKVAESVPAARIIAMKRDIHAVVDSWFQWTEAGSARSLPGGFVPVHINAKHHWQWHDQTSFDFDEWDLTMPKFDDAADKRTAIETYVRHYYDECDRLARDFPDTIRIYECDELFRSAELITDLYRFVGLDDGEPPSPDILHLNAQRYIYQDSAGHLGNDFLVGDFAIDDPHTQDDASDFSSDDEEELAQKRLPLPSSSEVTNRRFSVIVPDGARPGDTVRIAFKGCAFDATVPDGLRPGDSFKVDAPESMALLSDDTHIDHTAHISARLSESVISAAAHETAADATLLQIDNVPDH